MTFAHPYVLLLLLLLPVVAWLKGRRGSPPAFVYSSVKLVAGLSGARRSRAGAFLAAMRWLALALFIVAAAQPRKVSSETQITASGVDIVVAFDMSGSMLSEDFEVPGGRMSRFDMARSVLGKFVQQRPNDRIGLIVFATQAYIATPLTLDHDFFQQNLDRLQIGNIDPDSTAIGSAMATALNRLRDLKSKSRILILMTDGENNAGRINPLMAAQAAKALGVKVYTIGIGMQGSAPMPVFQGGQKIGYEQVPVDVDVDTLKKIADSTGGKYYRADTTENFHSIYDDIDKLEKTEATVKKYSHYTELFTWAVAAGLALLLAEVGLANTIWRRIP